MQQYNKLIPFDATLLFVTNNPKNRGRKEGSDHSFVEDEKSRRSSLVDGGGFTLAILS